MEIYLSIFTSILVISLLVFFHELGHFIFARLNGVAVNVFSIGFGLALFKKKIGNTEYRFSAIPLGGYVQMKGQNDLDPLMKSNDNDSYNSIKPYQRISILFGGPLFNFILAFILFFIVAISGFETLSSEIGELKKDFPAEKSGLLTGDKILSINNNLINNWKDVSNYIENSSGIIHLKILRNTNILNVNIEPQISESENIFGEKIHKRLIGISPSGKFEQISFEPIEALKYSWNELKSSTILIFQGLEKLVIGVLSLDQLGGIISMVEYTSKASETGLVTLLFLTALFSVNLGVVNLLPIPALDGGHIIFQIYEIFRGKSPNEKAMYYLTIFGWMILLTLMGIGMYNDMYRLATK
jgi:regulator of sigma E protease